MALSLRIPFPTTAIAAPSRRTLRTVVSRPIRVKVECRKKGLHPPFYEDTKVYCDGELVMVTSGTQPELNVDTWSGNHPFYLGQSMGYDDLSFFYDEEEFEGLELSSGDGEEAPAPALEQEEKK